MELKQLEYFVRVAEAGSFTRAAAILNVAQPALSRQIQHLEDLLKVKLFVRNGRGVVTTEEGERLLVQSKGILRQVVLAREEISAMRADVGCRMSIGMPASIASCIASPLAKRIRQELPNVELTIVQGRSSKLQEWLTTGQIDIGVVYDTPFSPCIEKIHLATNQLVMIQPPSTGSNAPIAFADICNTPLIIQCQGNMVRTLIEVEMRRQGHSPRVAMEIDNLRAIVDLVYEGFGSAVVSPRAISMVQDTYHLSVRPIFQPKLEINLSLAIPVRPLPRGYKSVVERVRRVVGDVYYDRQYSTEAAA